jgi:hypothetical protein
MGGFSMKTLFLALSLMTASFAQADSIKIYEGKTARNVITKFKVNPELGRAWVELYTNNNVKGMSVGTKKAPTLKIKVPGLSYDAATSTIVLAADGQMINCANVKISGSGIFTKTKITNDRCSLTSKKTKISIDDGFEVRKVSRLQVFLNVE